MVTGTAQLLALAATAYGVLAALAALLQAHQIHARRASCAVSAYVKDGTILPHYQQ